MQTLGHTCTGTCVCTMEDKDGEATLRPGKRIVNGEEMQCPGNRIFSGEETHRQIWDVKTVAEVSELVRLVRSSAKVSHVFVLEVF